MGTKVKIIGEDSKDELKPIEFVKVLTSEFTAEKSLVSADAWENIELIARDCYMGFDVMFVYDINRDAGQIVFGYFNDGVV